MAFPAERVTAIVPGRGLPGPARGVPDHPHRMPQTGHLRYLPGYITSLPHARQMYRVAVLTTWNM